MVINAKNNASLLLNIINWLVFKSKLYPRYTKLVFYEF